MSDEDSVRDSIISTAREYIGSHYLTGTYGHNPPNGNDSITASIVPLAVEGRAVTFMTDRTWRDLAVRAAEIYPYRGEHLRCCGRYSAYSNIGTGARLDLPQRSAPSTTTTPPARFRSFYEWYNRIAALAPGSPTEAFRDSAYGNGDYYPRRHAIEGSSTNYVYLGEDCYGKKHFDCIGFVWYVLIKVLGRPMWHGLPSDGVGAWSELGTSHEDPVNCRPGDVFISASHVAFVASTSPSVRLIHANGDQRGVEISAFVQTASTWERNFHVINLSRHFLGLR